ncbi:MAG: Uma2 family endonuclease [Treponema sp.]|nr:Uma2 family endonuclease [Treponema sp.]
MADAWKLEQYEEKSHTIRRENAPAKAYTYKDYLSWGDDTRFELIDGIPHMMSAPTRWHQQVIIEISRQLGNWLEDKPCEVYAAPFDVRLFPEDDQSDKVVVQPDVLVICDEEKLADERACRGAPDFVVEVVSKGTRGKDFGVKKALYEKAGVREYWIVEAGAVYKYVPVDGEYQETVFDLNEVSAINVDALPPCCIDFKKIAGLALRP